jgi:IS5 family transposase
MQGFCEKLAKTLAPVTLMEGKMYRTEDKQQLAFKDFYLPFGGKLNPTNRWVQLAQLIPWEDLEEEYAAGFAIESGQGAPAIPFRTALGALIIKEKLGITDEETVM